MTDGPRPPKVLRGAVVGYGFISERGHVPAYALPGPTKFEIVAVADMCAARREKARVALPGARIYESHEHLLAAERGRIDFVDVTTPPCDHAPIARAALAQGLHVLCEKPLATSGAEAPGDGHAGARGAARSLSVSQLQARARDQGRARDPRRRRHRPRSARDAPDVSKHPRQGRRRVAPRLAAREPILRRRHRHGPREPHLLSRVRLVRRFPDRHQREDVRLSARSTPKTTSHARSPSRMALPPRTSRGLRASERCIYTLHGDRRRHPRRRRRRRGHRDERRRGRLRVVRDHQAQDRVRVDGREPRQLVPLPVRPVRRGHRARRLLRKRDRGELRCVELITTAYASARDRSIERPLSPGKAA